jgi:hypothetical protein
MFPMNSPSQPNFIGADPFEGMMKPSQPPVFGQTPPPVSGFSQGGSGQSFFPSLGTTEGLPRNSVFPQYARGGAVIPKRGFDKLNQNHMGHAAHMAHMLSQYGQGDDKILAHINPEEARYLAQTRGGDINPYTGLPQFGFWNRLENAVKRFAGPAIGATIGSLIGGPMGGAALGSVLGGGVGGMFGHPNNRVGFGGGAMLPLAYHTLGSGVLPGASGLGGITSQMGSLFSGLGNIATPLMGGMGGGGGAGSGTPVYDSSVIGKVFEGGSIPSSYLSKGGSGMGGLGSFFTGGSGGGNILKGLASIFTGGSGNSEGGGGGLLGGLGSLLGGGGGAGGLLDTLLLGTAIAGTVGRKEKPSEDYKELQKPQWKPSDYELNVPEVERMYNPAPADYVPGIDPEHDYFAYKKKKKKKPVELSHGGYLDGDTDGHADKIEARLSDGEYVLSADVVSGLGNGNNRNGAKKLDLFQKNVRSHKATKGFPPAAKSIAAYMNMKH